MTTFGAALRLARRAQGITGKELAENAGVTQATISRYETGERNPQDPDVEKLAKALRVTEEFLFQDSALRAPIAVDAHMRRRATAKVGDWTRAESIINIIRLQLAALLESIDVHPDLYLPVFDLEEVTPEECATILREQWGMPIGPVEHLIQWLEAAGIFVLELDLPTQRIDGLSQRIGSYPVIVVNRNVPTDRKRLTLAHELGHLVMHADFASANLESEANEFAAAFLMPKYVIFPELRNISTARLFDLKRKWGVSAQAILERAFRLGRVNAADRTRLYKTFAKRGWRVREPYSEDLVPERPQLLASFLNQLRAAGLDDRTIGWRANVDLSNDTCVVNLASQPRLRAIS